MFRTRQYAVFFVFVAILFAFVFRLFFIQVISYDRFADLAEKQHNNLLTIQPARGTIYDRYLEPLAISLTISSVFADPRQVSDRNKTADILAKIIGADKQELLKQLNKTNKGFVWLKRKITPEAAQKIKSLRLVGIYLAEESKRNYPNENMACHIVGFAGMDNNGLDGIELLLDSKLKGRPGCRQLLRDARMKPIMYDPKEFIPAQNGYNVVLNIDSVIQVIVEEELAKMAQKFNASGASVVIMDPNTGQILALANYPSFDLNKPGKASRDIMTDTVVSRIFEPGSVFKVVTASAALDKGVCSVNDTFDCEMGNYNVRGRILHDYHAYGMLDFTNVVAKSSNIGVCKIAMKLGDKNLYDYIKQFGFGDKTDIDLPGEIGGICRPPREWSRSDITTIPMGQGVAVTSIQLACAISVIANGGYLVRPYVIDRITTWEGDEIFKNSTLIKRKVLKAETCTKMKKILREAVKVGTGKLANSKEYEICGKTGTAQMVNPAGGYFDSKYHATFIGFAPMDKPRIAMVVTASDPHPVHFGGNVAGPTFKNITERVLQYLESNTDGTHAFKKEGKDGEKH